MKLTWKEKVIMTMTIIILLLLAGTVEQDNGKWPAAPEPEHLDYRIQ
jgi:hypothetical protein